MPIKYKGWGGSLHQTFRILPLSRLSKNLLPYLSADGKSPDDLLKTLPYEKSRSSRPGTHPDPKRYRDGRQVYQSIGFLFEESGVIKVTYFGKTVARWIPLINENNKWLLLRHATYALARCQLQNPMDSGQKYDSDILVFPFLYIWKAFLMLDGKLFSEELNRSLFKVKNHDDLLHSIESIKYARKKGNPRLLGRETISGDKKNDRIISWIALASFGWTLFDEKGQNEFYELSHKTRYEMEPFLNYLPQHKIFKTTSEYVNFLSFSALLPKDLR